MTTTATTLRCTACGQPALGPLCTRHFSGQHRRPTAVEPTPPMSPSPTAAATNSKASTAPGAFTAPTLSRAAAGATRATGSRRALHTDSL
jgi:hypothetical protein